MGIHWGRTGAGGIEGLDMSVLLTDCTGHCDPLPRNPFQRALIREKSRTRTQYTRSGPGKPTLVARGRKRALQRPHALGSRF